MQAWLPNGAAVQFGRADFVGQGGQGSVYARGDRAFKVYLDPANALPAGKIRELAAVRDPDVLRPLEALRDRQGATIGHTMRFVPDTEVLCTLFARAFRQQHGVTPEIALGLVRRLRALVAAAHAAGCLVVDLNEMNFLVSRDWQRLCAIDVDSWQTPHFPATALMESVRDRHAPDGRFDDGTDWFAFAITSFQLLRGIHPYKGQHPSVKGIDARMRANLSVLHPDVVLPRVVYSEQVVPDALRRWYDAVLQRGHRGPPPTSLQGVVRLASAPRTTGGGDTLDLIELAELPERVRAWFHHLGTTVAIAGAQAFVDGRPQPIPAGASALAFTPRRNRPILAWIEGGRLRLHDLVERRAVPIDLAATKVTCARARVYIQSGPRILELGFVEGKCLVPAPRVVAQVLEHATTLFPGCAIQSALGAVWVSAFAGSGLAYQVRLPELDGASVVHAKYDGGVLMVVAAKAGTYRRIVVRFAEDHQSYDVRSVPSAPMGLEFVALDSGVCVGLDEDERLEVFVARPGDDRIRHVEDPRLAGDMQLWRGDGTVVCTRARRVVRLGMR